MVVADAKTAEAGGGTGDKMCHLDFKLIFIVVSVEKNFAFVSYDNFFS